MADQPIVHRAAFDELSPRDLYDVLRLRSEVFVVEQACAFLDLDGRDHEPTTQHLWTRDERGIVATLRVLHDGGDVWSIGRIVTRSDARSAGAAARLIAAGIEVAESAGAGEIRLGGQSHLADWYRRFGFEVAGPEYVEDGIPHVPMRRPGVAR